MTEPASDTVRIEDRNKVRLLTFNRPQKKNAINNDMRLPFVNLGLVPEFAGSYLLQANIGAQRAAQLFYTAEWINAEHAGLEKQAGSSENIEAITAFLEKRQPDFRKL